MRVAVEEDVVGNKLVFTAEEGGKVEGSVGGTRSISGVQKSAGGGGEASIRGDILELFGVSRGGWNEVNSSLTAGELEWLEFVLLADTFF